MKKLAACLSAVAVFTIIITGCGNNAVNGSDPQAVLKEFFKRMSEKDVDGASKLATTESQSMMSMMKMGLEQSKKMNMKNEEDGDRFKDTEFGDAKINGESATVPIINKKKEFSFDFPLKKQDGSWKVDFSLASMMQMASKMAEKNGYHAEDPSQKMSPEDMQKAMDMADSLSKNMDPKQLEQLKEMMDTLKKGNQ